MEISESTKSKAVLYGSVISALFSATQLKLGWPVDVSTLIDKWPWLVGVLGGGFGVWKAQKELHLQDPPAPTVSTAKNDKRKEFNSRLFWLSEYASTFDNDQGKEIINHLSKVNEIFMNLPLSQKAALAKGKVNEDK